jgi:hypothetical protein
MTAFDGFDVAGFWRQSDHADGEYVDVAPSDETIARVEAELGYRLPSAYIALARRQNGGMPYKTAYRTSKPSPWAEDRAAITGIHAIGGGRRCSLLGRFGSRFWIDKWLYPDIGIYFADCPSGGHDMMCLDYRACGPTGEPSVVHVSQAHGYKITVIAPNFESFIRALEEEEAFDFD